MQAVDELTDQAEKIADQQKRAGADQVEAVAKAVHGAAEQLEQQMPNAAELVHAAASRLEQGAGALRERNVRELMSTVNDFGHKEPLALFGSAVLAGFAISRFLKSSANNSQ